MYISLFLSDNFFWLVNNLIFFMYKCLILFMYKYYRIIGSGPKPGLGHFLSILSAMMGKLFLGVVGKMLDQYNLL